MNYLDIWDRVQGQKAVSFYQMAGREAAIAECCRALYRMGASRPLLDRLYRDARKREHELHIMGHILGEADWTAPVPEAVGKLSVLIQYLGIAAGDYDPGHPIFGAVLEECRRECKQAQRALLEL